MQPSSIVPACKVGLVGVCAAGKSTITSMLRPWGFNIKPIAQEHSYVPKMWQVLTKPDVLIFLEVNYENTVLRRRLDWTREEYEEQLRRLAHARAHADLVIDTNDLTPDQVAKIVVDYLIKT